MSQNSKEENLEYYTQNFSLPLLNIVQECCTESLNDFSRSVSMLELGYKKKLAQISTERNQLLEEKQNSSLAFDKQKLANETKIENLQKENEALKNEIAKLEKTIDGFRSSDENLKKRLSVIDSTRDENLNLREKIDELTSSLNSQKKIADDLKNTNNKLKSENSNLLKSNLQLVQDATQAKSDNLELQKEVAREKQLNIDCVRVVQKANLPLRPILDSSGKVISFELSEPIDVQLLVREAIALKEQNELLESQCKMVLQTASTSLNKDPVSKETELNISKIETYAKRTRDNIFISLLKALVFIVYYQQSDGKSKPLEIWKSVNAKPLEESFEFFKIVYLTYQNLFLQLLFEQSIYYLGIEDQKSLVAIDSIISSPTGFVSQITRKYFRGLDVELTNASMPVESVVTEFV